MTRLLQTVSMMMFLSSAILLAQPRGGGSAEVPIESILNPDGTINMSHAVQGSINAEGWQLITEKGGAPRFVKAGEPPSVSSVPDDIFWSNKFAWPGVYSNPAGGGEGASVVAVGPTGAIYVGGYFNHAGEVPANNVAKYSGGQWDTLWAGISASSSVKPTAMTFLGSDLYVAGISTAYNGSNSVSVKSLAKWDGSAWSDVGGGVVGGSATVHALAVKGSALYVGGSFTVAGSTPANNIARWNGTTWEALGAGVNGTVFAIAFLGDSVYAGGSFTTAGGNNANRIARWNGTKWDSLATGVNQVVRALASYGNLLYVGGGFTTAGGISANRMAAWTESGGWSAMGSGLTGSYPDDNSVRGIAVNPRTGAVYAVGDFTVSGTTPVKYVAKWSNSQWSAVGAGFNREPICVAIDSSDNVYATGFYTNTGGLQTNTIAKFDGSQWRSLGTGNTNGLFNSVQTVAVSGSDVYVGGSFTTAGTIRAGGIAKWNGIQMDSLGSGVPSGTVYSISVLGTIVYIAGTFVNAGGNPDADYVAMWDGSNWYGLGKGVDAFANVVYAVSASEVYVGGRFTYANNANGSQVGVNRIAKWNGAKWDSLGAGPNVGIGGSGTPEVWALKLVGDSLYVGGAFTSIAGSSISTSCVAKWVRTTNTWSALGSGTNSAVRAFASSGNLLYVGGSFTTAGGNSYRSLAIWDGLNWSSPWSSDINGTVVAIAINGNDMYVGGQFGNIGAPLVGYIAKWNGSSWSKLGGGLDNNCNTLAIAGSYLYAGGFFSWAGGKQSNYFARWEIVNAAPSAPTLATPADGATNQDTSLTLSWNASTNASTYALQVSTDAGFGTTVVNQTGLVSLNYLVNGLSKNTLYYWRVSASNPAGTSSYSTRSFRTKKNPPTAPANVVVTDSSSKTLAIKWRKNTEADFLRYRIYRGTTAAPTTMVDSTTGGIADTTKTFTGLMNGTRYYARVTAVDSAGNESSYSNEVNAIPADRIVPAIPQNLTIFDTTSTKIGIKWRKNSEADFMRYRIYRGTSPNPTTKVDSTTAGVTDTSKTFTGLTNGTRYYLRITAVDSAGNESAYSNQVNGAPDALLGVENPLSLIPKEYSLSQNYPNPFNPSTVIRYGLPEKSHVILEVFDVLGRQVAVLLNVEQDARFYELSWSTSVPSGIYFYRLSAAAMANPERTFQDVRKMILMK